jgi:hypothetical protein
MASTLTNPQISAAITVALAGGAAPAISAANVQHAVAQTLTAGASAGQVNKVYSAARSVSNGTPDSIDLTALTDPLGQALNFTKVSAILINNLSTTVGRDLTIGGGTNGLFTAAPNPVKANGGIWFLADPTAQITVDGTHKIITVAIAAGTDSYNITVIGQ